MDRKKRNRKVRIASFKTKDKLIHPQMKLLCFGVGVANSIKQMDSKCTRQWVMNGKWKDRWSSKLYRISEWLWRAMERTNRSNKKMKKLHPSFNLAQCHVRLNLTKHYLKFGRNRHIVLGTCVRDRCHFQKKSETSWQCSVVTLISGRNAKVGRKIQLTFFTVLGLFVLLGRWFARSGFFHHHNVVLALLSHECFRNL